MYYKSGRLLLTAIILLIASTAQAQTKTVDEIVAWVNSDIILKSDFETRRAQIRNDLAEPAPRGRGLQGAQLDQAFNDQIKLLLRDLIDETLLLQQAKDMGLNADLEVVKTMEQLRQERRLESLDELEKAIVAQGFSVDEFKQNIKTRYLTSQVLQREVYGRVVVTTEEMRKYYDANIKNFDRPAGIRVREISVYTENRGPAEIESQRKKIEEALAAVKKGDNFADVASKYSESQTAQEGGDLGFFVKGELAKPLEDVASTLEKGQVSDVINLNGAFMILKVEDKHEGGTLPFELAQKEIQDILWTQGVQPKIREYLTKLRADGFIRVADGYADLGQATKNAKVSENKN
jgi:peptidyl-prolyl cis-trans isomerase SurA